MLSWSARALGDRPGFRGEAVVLPVPVSASGVPAAQRDIAAITYGANPDKKGLVSRIRGVGAGASRR